MHRHFTVLHCIVSYCIAYLATFIINTYICCFALPSDCTAEGLKATIGLNESIKEGKITIEPTFLINDERLFDACNVILSYQNIDGGWATYENNRGYRWYEMLNPSEVFGDIMIDYSYVECSSACVTALVKFAEQYPSHRASEIQNSIQAGASFIRSIQRYDGSWYGSWGVRFD